MNNELIRNIEYVGSLTLEGRKHIKEYVQNLEQENNQLKLDFELYKDNHIYKNYEVERKDKIIKELRNWLEDKTKEPISYNLLYDGKQEAYKEVLLKLNELDGKNGLVEKVEDKNEKQ